MVSCAVRICRRRAEVDNKKTSGVTFHRFPQDSRLREIWEKFVNRKNWKPTKYSVLCSEHFLDKHFDRTSLCYVRLREDAIPTLNQVKIIRRPPYQINEPESSNYFSTSTVPLEEIHGDCGREDLVEVDIKDPRFPATHFAEKLFRNSNNNGIKRLAVTPQDEVGNLEPNTRRIKLEENFEMFTEENELLPFESVDCGYKKENVDLDESSNIVKLEENYETATAINTDEKKDIFKSSTYSRDEERLERIIRLLEEQLAAVVSENDELRKENEALKATHTHTRPQNWLESKHEKILKQIFTSGQARTMLESNEPMHWNSDDLTVDVTLQSISPEAHQYLVNVRKIPSKENASSSPQKGSETEANAISED